MNREETLEAWRRSVNRAIDLFDSHLPQGLPVPELAACAGISLWHFHRVFLACMGESVQGYLLRRRLEWAKRELLAGSRMGDMAMACGFSSASHFASAFKKRYGASPRSWLRTASKGEREVSTERPGSMAIPPNCDKPVAGLGPSRLCTLPERHIAYVRHLGNYDARIGLAWAKLMGWARRTHNVKPGSERISISVDHPDICPEGKIRFDACIAVSPDCEASGPVSLRTLPGGLHYSLIYRGAIRDLSRVYAYLFSRLLPESGHSPGNSTGYRIHRERVDEQIRGLCDLEILIPLESQSGNFAR